MHVSTPSAALMDLLLALFSEQELRMFVAHRLPDGVRIAGLLPAPPATPVHLADLTVQAMQRHGLVGPGLFDALLAAVPGRRADIERTAARWAAPTPPPLDSPPSAAPAGDPAAWDVYMSYARTDLTACNTLATALHEHGLRVFFDEWEVAPGDVLVHRLDTGLRDSRNGVLVVSRAAFAHPWVLQEYAALLTRAVDHGLRLVPVLIADAELPPLLATRVCVDIRGQPGPTRDEAVRRLALTLRGQPPGPPPRPQVAT